MFSPFLDQLTSFSFLTQGFIPSEYKEPGLTLFMRLNRTLKSGLAILTFSIWFSFEVKPLSMTIRLIIVVQNKIVLENFVFQTQSYRFSQISTLKSRFKNYFIFFLNSKNRFSTCIVNINSILWEGLQIVKDKFSFINWLTVLLFRNQLREVISSKVSSQEELRIWKTSFKCFLSYSLQIWCASDRPLQHSSHNQYHTLPHLRILFSVNL